VLERAEGRGADYAVNRQAVDALEATGRRVGVRAETTVDGARREAMLLKEELDGGDVPAALADAHGAAAERGPAADAERLARLRTRDAVGRQVVGVLEPLGPADRLGAPDAVDCAAVVVERLERHLKGRSEEHTSELQSQSNLVCRLMLEKK